MPIINITNQGTKWRVFEKEMLEKHFGEVIDVRIGDLDRTREVLKSFDDLYVFWRPNSDEMLLHEYNLMLEQRDVLKNLKMINDPINYLKTHCKEEAFKVWKENDIRIPNFQIIENDESFSKNLALQVPFLMRLNNEVSGRASYLINDVKQIGKNIQSLNSLKSNSKHKNSFTKKIAVEFIDARKENDKYNLSYRIIVAGNKVVTGYARLSEANDWVAITGKFKYEMGNLFLKYQERCNKMVKENHDTIVKAVSSLGLNLQGVDIIENKQGDIYFLECQPGFSTGYSDWPKPFYNPYYPELVRFIQENEGEFKTRCPMYYNNWLNKEKLFDEIFKNLKQSLGEDLYDGIK